MPRTGPTDDPARDPARRSARVDCLVVGGGPAGLAAAVQLGRLRRSCVVVDDDAGRSLWSQVTRNHLGFPDGVTAADLRLLGQRQAVGYGADLRHGEVTGLRRARGRTGGFVAAVVPAEEGEPDDATPGMGANRARERRHGARLGERETRRRTRIRARTVVLATGVIDAFPSFAGRDECVGISLFWCIVCDGFESIGRHVAVVGDDEEAIGTAFGLRHFTDRVTLATGRRRTRASTERLRSLEARDVTVLHGPVETYRHEEGRIRSIVVGPSGSRSEATPVDCEMVFVSTPKRPRTELARRLRARADGAGYLVTDGAGRTTVSGLYAAGDATTGHSHQVTTAAHLGATAATAVNFDLYDPEEQGVGTDPRKQTTRRSAR